MRLFRDIIVCILALISTGAAVEVWLLTHQIRTSQGGISQSLRQTIDDIDATVIVARGAAVNANMVLGRVEQASENWAEASKAQSEYWGKLQSQTITTLGKAGEASEALANLLANTDKSLNQELIPQWVELSGEGIVAVQTLNEAIREMNEASGLVLADAHAAMTDPAISQARDNILATLSHIKGTTADIDKAADQLPGIAEDIKKVSDTSQRYAKPLAIARIISLFSHLIDFF
jgi:hypothetical protein